MKHFLFKTITVFILLVLVRPGTSQAQFTFPYCPVGMMNNTTTIALTSDAIYNDFVPGNYLITILNDNWDLSTNGACGPVNAPVTITKSQNLSTCFPGGPNAGGICIPNPDANCPFPGNDAFQQGSTSIQIYKLDGTLVLLLNYTNYVLDDCIYIAFPVVWDNYPDLDWSTSQATISWTTYTEENMDHFSIEKSTDGSHWYKIAHVPATNIPHTYTYTSYIINRKNYYRVVAIDWDCHKQYSAIVYQNCPSNVSSSICPDNFTPPNLPQDCISNPIQPSISGPNSICDSSRKLFRLNNLKGQFNVTWSLSPSNMGTIIPVGRFCIFYPSGTSGSATLTASYVLNGTTYTYTKNFTVGAAPINVFTSNTIDQCTTFYTHTATISPAAGAIPSNYKWYVNGSLIGIGFQKSWTLPANQWLSYEIRYSTPCGTSYYYGNTMGLIYDLPRSPEFTVSPNPAKSVIRIGQRPPPCGFPPLQRSKLMRKITDKSTYVKVFDMYGGLRKMVQFKAVNSTMEINAAGLPIGWYYIHVIRDGQTVTTEKVWLDR
jgi:hypothetical protein